MKKGNYSLLGRLVSVTLGLFLLADAALRFLPLDRISFRAWEVVTQFAPYDAAFEPDRRFSTERDFGDLANMANLPRFREYRRGTTFTTDSLGFRNSEVSLPEGIPHAILVGDSYGAGATVDDHETLAAQLGSVSGCRIYNAAGGLVMEAPRIRELAHRLGMKSGLVIDEVLEGAIFLRAESPPEKGFYERLVAMSPARVQDLLVRVRGWWTISPLQILANRVFRQLEDDQVLPNRYDTVVVQRTLRSGDPTLFVPEDIAYSRGRGLLPATADRWVHMSSELEKAGLTLGVVLVPRKYTVYQALLREEPPASEDQLGGSLRQLERELRAAGIPVVNLTNPFRAQAGPGLERGDYLYWRDDTHWNARGIRLAALEINRRWNHEFETRCRVGS